MTWEEFKNTLKQDKGVRDYKVNGHLDGVCFRSSKTFGQQLFIFTHNRSMYFMNWSGVVLLFQDLEIDGMYDIYKAIK